MAKHTPGPWNWYQQHGKTVVESQKETVAYIQTLNEADADLVAAAPAMYEAINAVLRSGLTSSTIAQLNSVVRRAEGKYGT